MTQDEEQRGRLVPFSVRTDVEPAPEVLDGEIVEEATERRPARWVPSTVVRVVQHEPIRRRVRTVAGVAVTIGRGFESWSTRAWDAASFGVYRRQIRAAEASGDQQALGEWVDRRERATDARHKRLLELPKVAASAARVTIGTLLGLVMLMLVTALVVQLAGAGTFLGVVDGVLSVIAWGVGMVAVLWLPFVASLPLWILLAAYREGRRYGTTPDWLATSSDRDLDIEIDESTIARALDALRIPQVSQYIKAGNPLQFLTPCRESGRGTHAVIRLPSVAADRIVKRRADLAAGLYRKATEVWPGTGDEAGILDLWIANKGALAEGAGPYPLLTSGTVDVFDGVPFGRTLRGDVVKAPLSGRNTITGGMPGQGKSASARTLMLGCALDPYAELRIFIPDTNNDFEKFRPRCSRYVMGDGAAEMEEICLELEDLAAEVQSRGELLVKHDTDEVTRDLARKGVGLHFLVTLLEEAHVAFNDEEFGERIKAAAESIVRLGRKRGIHLVASTQAPDSKSVPPNITKNCSNGVAFAVARHQENDALLGQGAYSAGHRATDLIPGVDIGTCVAKGLAGEGRSQIVQVYYVGNKGHDDQVTPIIKRALDAIAKLEHGLPGANTVRTLGQRDLLTDVAEVVGPFDKPKVTDVCARLRELAPDWALYREQTGQQLVRRLVDLGVRVPSTGGKYPISGEEVRRVLDARATEDLDED